MPAKKKAPPVVVDSSGFFVKLPLTPRQAVIAAALLEQVGAIFKAGAELGQTIGAAEGEVTRALATRPRRRPRARKR